MPGYIHGLVQVKVSFLVKDGVRTGGERSDQDGVRTGGERGISEGAGWSHCLKLSGAVPSLLPTQTSSG